VTVRVGGNRLTKEERKAQVVALLDVLSLTGSADTRARGPHNHRERERAWHACIKACTHVYTVRV
jgi:hypothetical protein